ncbi:unnamed protein product [Alternaria alternata]
MPNVQGHAPLPIDTLPTTHVPATPSVPHDTIMRLKTAQEQDAPIDFSESELEQEQLKNSVRGLMRDVPSSVAVLTVASIDPKTKKHVPMGVAVSSLSTVSLDPPTISFNIKQPSKTLDAIRATDGLFRVHFPAANRSGAKLVDLFSRGNHPDAYDLRSKQLKLHQPIKKIQHSIPSSLAPQVLAGYVRAAMECEVTHEFPVADHVILVAKVNGLEQKTAKGPAIMYINGEYRSPEGKSVYVAENAQPSAASADIASVWEYPLFPGEKERRHYMEQIKAIIRSTPAYYKDPSRETSRTININLPYPPADFGIDLELLIAECRQEMGLGSPLRPGAEDKQVLSEFYGVLTPSMRDRIVDRAKKLVALDERYLSQPYRSFLFNLGVNPNSKDFLPSDIMKPLRAANLAPRFKQDREQVIGETEDIIKAEQIEHRLREHLRSMKYEDARREPFEVAMEAIGERKGAAMHFKKARARLLTQSHPTLFDASAIDITGEVTEEELRVVLCRLINYLNIKSQIHFRQNIERDPHFLFALEETLQPWFIWNVSWDDLEERVKHFVQSTPLRAIAWSAKGRLAAMGLHWDATVTLPSNNSSKQVTEQSLLKGVILDTLVAKELKNYYGSGTEEENQAIAKYLKETYSFDVTHKPMQYTSAASDSQSSADEMRQAMATTLETSQEEAWFDDGEPGQPPAAQDGATRRKAGWTRRIRKIEGDRSLRITRLPGKSKRIEHGDNK